MKTRADYIKENLEMFITKLENKENFSFVKIGDGEFDCMQQKPGGNSDGHPYSKDLAEKLCKSFVDLVQKDVYIAEWFYSNPPINKRDEGNIKYLYDFLLEKRIMPKFIRPFELLLLGWGNLELPYLFNFYKTVKNDTRKKIYAGPARMNELKNMLNVDHYIEIPLINAFSEHERILNDLKNNITDNCIVMLSIGMQSPVVANEILNFNSNITILDIGSGFDSYFVNQTRGLAQATNAQAKNYYKEL